ncbi:MAG: transposase [Acidobacteria bacterium]|nr:transposase [Acidobacteriota bacterium]
MFRISRTIPAYYFTSIAHHRLPIFRTDKVKQILCDAFSEVRTKHGILILAYVIMLDHVHLLVYSQKEMSDALRTRLRYLAKTRFTKRSSIFTRILFVQDL